MNANYAKIMGTTAFHNESIISRQSETKATIFTNILTKDVHLSDTDSLLEWL